MKMVYFFFCFSLIFLSYCGLPGPDYYSKGAKKLKDGTITTKRNASRIRDLEIYGYTDSVFPNKIISHYTSLKTLSVIPNYLFFLSEEEKRNEIFRNKHYDSLELIKSDFQLRVNKILLDSLKNLEKLALYDFYLPHFPVELSSLKMLKELRLQLFSITYFSSDLSNFQNLEFLEITGFGRSEMPAEIIFPSKLKELTLWINISPEIANSIDNSNIEKLVIRTSWLSMRIDEKLKLIEALSKIDNLKICTIYLESCDEKSAIKAALKNHINFDKLKLLVDGNPFCI